MSKCQLPSSLVWQEVQGPRVRLLPRCQINVQALSGIDRMRAVCQGTHYPLFEVTCSLFGNLVFLFIPPGLQSLATSFNTKLLLMSSTVSKLQGTGLLMSGLSTGHRTGKGQFSF